jgi:hypothetical protein
MTDYGDVDAQDGLDVDDGYPQVTPTGQPIWLTDLAQWLRDAGLTVIEYEGWQTRARGSGGYSINPLCVMWHHTASGPSWDGQRDADYIATGDDDAPLANLYIRRDGTVYVIAAGATNTNGKGKSLTFSRGTVPTDGMNSHAVGVEMGNDGIGEFWPQEQIDAAFIVSNVINAMLGNIPRDLATHHEYAPDRKIDPARADAVLGPWRPPAVNGSGSWDVEAVRAEADRRLTAKPPTTPVDGTNEGESTMTRALVRSGSEQAWNAYVVHDAGKFWLPTNEAIGRVVADFGYQPIAVDRGYMEATGPVIGERPENADAWGYWDGIT